ncbi:hypothetical protein M407DRAFT_66466, partial [Tulasnella calospora MUT 4182]
HEHIVRLEGFVEDLSKNIVWLIFLWEENGSLKDFAASHDWEIPERLWLIDDVARGVEYLHGRSPPICHGDLKSINVLVTSKCRAVITDFGSARRLSPKDLDTQYTLRWAAPELLMDDKPSLWSDIWALGWIFYEVMTNSIPFQNLQKDSIVIKHVIGAKLPSVTDHTRMSLILGLCSVIIKCWSISPHERPTAEHCRKSISWMVSSVGFCVFEQS